MNVSFLLHLYPAEWRHRYEREFRAMLAEHPASAMDALDIVLGAIDAHRHKPATSSQTGNQPRSSVTEAIFFAHLSLFVAIIMVLAIINVATTAGNWWVLYPLWAWGTIVATHAGLTFRWRGLLGAHLAFYLGLNAGLIAINLTQGGDIWFIWPMLALGVPLASHLMIAIGHLSLIRAHLVATVAGFALLLVALTIGGAFELSAILLTGGQLTVLLAAHWLLRHHAWTLLRVHAFVYAGSLTLMLIANLLDDSGTLWVQYPFAMWTILLAGHALLHVRIASWQGSEWEAMMLEALGTRGEPETQRRLLGGMGIHVFLFLLASVAFVVVNVIGGGGFWAIWPIGVWYVVLALHAGYVLSPHRIAGSLLFGWVAAAAGLIAIDIFFSGGDTWWYWPVMWSAVIMTIGVGWLAGGQRRLFWAHMLGGIALAFALIVTDLVTGSPLWWFYPVAAIVLTWIIHVGLTLDITRALNPISDKR